MREFSEKEMNENVKCWCNIFGFPEPDMPEPIKKAMSELWEENPGCSLCTMVEFEGKYFVALKHEYDRCFANDMGLSMNELYEEAFLKGGWLEKNERLSTSEVILSNGKDRHELTVLVPIDTSKEAFKEIVRLCETVVYNLEDLPMDERNWRAIKLAIRYGGIGGDHHKAWVIDQMVRILAGERYDKIVADACDGEDGPNTYDWDCGIAP